MAKKSKEVKPTDDSTSDAIRRPGVVDWFEHWPDLLGRRWPEALRPMSVFGETVLIEQYADEDGTLVVRAEVPGVDSESDLDVSVEDGRLTVSGSREERHEHKDKGLYRSEFRYGSFSRTLQLPAGAKSDDIEASYEDGILEVRVPVDADAENVTSVPISRS
jgi:HSP20 family protein